MLDILDRLDGLFLTGSPSNVEPHHYIGDPSEPGTWHDPHRDLAALELIPAAIRVGMPLFAICRGFQEMNVSFGGTLHQCVHDLPDYHMHKENPEDPLEVQYGPSHESNSPRVGCCTGFPAFPGRWSIRFTRRELTGWPKNWCRKPGQVMDWWKRSRSGIHRVSPSVCSGILSGNRWRIRFRERCFAHSERHAARTACGARISE